MKRCFALLGISALSIAALAPAAVADPSHAKNATQLELVCGGAPYQVSVNGNGKFTPAHILDGTGVAVPYSVDITTTFTPPGGPTQTQRQTASKGGPHKGAVDCTIPFQSFSGPQGTFTIEGTATRTSSPDSPPARLLAGREVQGVLEAVPYPRSPAALRASASRE
jgi:hypothetical protein